MKKISIFILGITMVLAGCQKKSDDTILGLTTDQRIAAALAKYQSILSSAPYGWKVLEKSGVAFNGGASDSVKATFIYYMKFTDSNQVTMYSDFDTIMASTPKTSTFRIKSLQRPTLLFDTYSYIHVPCDPNPAISKSPLDAGLGWGTDFEFQFADNADPSQLGDTIHLTGLTNNAQAYMVKATQADQTIFTGGQFGANLRGFQSVSKILTYWKRFVIGSVTYEIGQLDLVNKLITISWLDASGNVQTINTPFYYGFDGSVILSIPLVNGSTTITGFNTFNYNGTGVSLTVLGPNTTSVINPSAVALKLDLNAPTAWWNLSATTGDYYYSYYGFHVNGVDDYYGVSKLANWWYMLFWAKYNVASGYDAFAGVVNGSLIGQATYSPAALPATSTTRTTFTTDGRIIFKSLGTFGAATSILNTTVKTQILDASGYYLVKINATSYDMVSAKDAKSWISWSLF